MCGHLGFQDYVNDCYQHDHHSKPTVHRDAYAAVLDSATGLPVKHRQLKLLPDAPEWELADDDEILRLTRRTGTMKPILPYIDIYIYRSYPMRNLRIVQPRIITPRHLPRWKIASLCAVFVERMAVIVATRILMIQLHM